LDREVLGREAILYGVMQITIIAKLDEIIELSTDLKTTRPEIINAILKEFFASKVNHIEKGREIIIRCRRGRL